MTCAGLGLALRVSVVVAAVTGCGVDDVDGEGGTGGTALPAQSGGASSSGGAPASGGRDISSVGGTLGSGGLATGGVSVAGGTCGALGAGGVSGTGGAASGGTASGGQGPAGSGGAGGGQGGAGGSGVRASAGCGKQGRPAGGVVSVANDHIYTFPGSYDGKAPLPLFLGFHACGNPIEQFRDLSQGSRFETSYVRAFPRSSDSGGCWNYEKDIARVRRVFDELTSTYCIDLNRVFAAGHSSGAQMIVQILTHRDAADHVNFKAVSPVAASDYGALSGSTPVLYIQGKKDTIRGDDGARTVQRFRSANSCQTTSVPYPVEQCQRNGRPVNPGCVAYSGCAAPTIWCSHDDPHYGTTSHGVPCFAIQAMQEFFEELP